MAILAIPRVPEFIRALQQRLPEKTVRHVISVASWIDYVADAAGVAAQPAVHAGLLHDYCKKMRASDLLSLAKALGISVSPAFEKHPKLLHGPVAAEVIQRDLGIDDPAVYEAIFWHTTGRPGLGRVGQALYFADFTEPFRPMAESSVARTMLRTDGFDAALRYVARVKLTYVNKSAILDPKAHEFLEWLEQNDR